MKQGNLKKKIGSLLLVAALIVNSFPAISLQVHAAEASEPSGFATKEQLRAFNTDDTDEAGANSAKLCFGNNSQEWWIAGSQKADSLTLFAASPLATGQKFDPDYDPDNPNTETKAYSSEWGCTYDAAPSQVNANHYGASPLRTILKELETTYFSSAEQGLMKDTTIYTNDVKNDCVYSTKDKLYLAYRFTEYNSITITVGENASDNLYNGLRIDCDYLGNEPYWLRAPHTFGEKKYALVVSNAYVQGVSINEAYALVPAFELDLSTVLFASTAKAASSENAEAGTIADGTAMTLRLDGTGKAIGTAVYDNAAGKIKVQKDANAEGTVSLVVQGNDGSDDWSYSVQAGETTVVTKQEIQEACDISGEIDFAECKIWLETTIDRVVYAKMAEAGSLPTEAPTEKPTALPTVKPTEAPTEKPTAPPTQKPTEAPTEKPTSPPTQKPTEAPTEKPAPSPTPPNGGTVDKDGNVSANPTQDPKATAAPALKVAGKLTMGAKEKVTVKATTNQASVKAASSKTNVVKVSTSGRSIKLTAGKKAGKADITVTAGNRKAAIKVTVKAAPKKIKAAKKTVNIQRGKKATTKVKFTPKNAGAYTVKVTNAKQLKKKVTVTVADGKITVKADKKAKKGTLTVKLQAYNRKKTTFKVKVK